MTSDVAQTSTAAAGEFSYPSPIVVGSLRLLAVVISKIFWFIKYRGRENIPVDQAGLIVVSNHSTYIDPAWIAAPIRKNLRFMAWDQAFEWRTIGRLIRYLGAFPVKHRTTVTKSAVVEALRSLRRGAALVIFPEGEREFADGKMLEFKSGAVHIALNAGVPILPVSIRGGSRIWPRGWKYPRLFRRVEVTYHPLISIPERPEGIDLDDHLEMFNKKLIETIRSAM